MPDPSQRGFNLLELRPVRALIRWRGFPGVFQVVTLACFVGLLVLGWGQHAPDGTPAKLYAKSNLVNLVIWGLWWPIMIWVAVAFGRAWCAICPLELVADSSERAARRLGVRQLGLGRWLRAGWMILFLYGIVQILVAGAGLHRAPAHTSWFLLVMLVAAALVGFFFKHRAYCRGFCPVGLLLGTYGRGSMLAVRARHTRGDEPALRDAHAGPAAACPSLLNPPKLNSSKDCLIYGACVKASDQGQMAIVLRRPFAATDAREPMASWPITLFVILVSGFVTYELTTNWPAGKTLFLWVPNQLAHAMGLATGNGWIVGLWKLVVWPLALWSGLGGLVVMTGGVPNLASAWRRLALPMVVVVAAGHMAKGLEKLATWNGYLPGALEEPLGVANSRAYATGTLAKPETLLSMQTLSAIGVVLVVAGCCFGLRELRLADPAGHRRLRPALLALSLFFGFLTLRWGLWA